MLLPNVQQQSRRSRARSTTTIANGVVPKNETDEAPVVEALRL
jgi:hypothetical protein